MSYEKYFKDVSDYDVIDFYRTHRIFGLNDEVLCHASKKLLLSGVRTGGKSLEQDVKEARDSLNRWLEMLTEDLGNDQEKDGWTPAAIRDAALKDYTLDDVIPDDCVLEDWVAFVAVDADGEVGSYTRRPVVREGCNYWSALSGYSFIAKVKPPLNFKNCIWQIKNE